jgi:hypothetical protein
MRMGAAVMSMPERIPAFCQMLVAFDHCRLGVPRSAPHRRRMRASTDAAAHVANDASGTIEREES